MSENRVASVVTSPWFGAVGMLVGVLIAVIGTIGPPPLQGPDTVMLTADQWRYLWFGGIVLVIFSVQAFATLYRKNAGLQSELDAALAKLEKRRVDLILADRLTEHYEYGITDILNKPPESENDFKDRWLSEEKKWTEKALNLMKQHGCTKQDLTHVRMIGVFNVLNLHPHGPANHALSMFVVRLGRVADISTKYAE
jgi:hypothetical protein